MGNRLKKSEHATQISIFTFTVSQRKSVNFAEAVVSRTYVTTVVQQYYTKYSSTTAALQ